MLAQGSSEPEGSNTSAATPSLPPPSCDIYDTTFSLHRVSPLFVGSNGLSDDRLHGLEQRLRDILVGDVVRGVEVGLGNDGRNDIGSAGILEAVTIAKVTTPGMTAASHSAIQITLQYEHALCLSVLLPLPEAADPVATSSSQLGRSALYFPLLLLRMPAALKSIVIGFLSDTFDCRVSPMQLSSMDIIRNWEFWARETTIPVVGPLAKDAVLTLSFGPLKQSNGLPGLAEKEIHGAASSSETADATTSLSPASLGIKTIDIFIPNQDLRAFLAINRQHESGARDGRRDSDKPSWLDKATTPFAYALAHYVQHHLALNVAHPAVAIVRIACGGFVLSENRLKVFAGPAPTEDIDSARHRAAVSRLLEDLVMRAAG